MSESDAKDHRRGAPAGGHRLTAGLGGAVPPPRPAGPVPGPAAAAPRPGTMAPATVAPAPAAAGSAQAGGNVRMSLEKAMDLALSHYRAGRLDLAERVASQIVEARPRHAPACNLLGAVLLTRGNAAGAVKCFQRAIRLDERNAQFHSNLGEAERQRGKLREAGIALSRAVELDPGSAQAHNNLGILQYDRGAFADAEQAYRKALAVDAAYPEAHNNLGNALRMLGRREEAVEEYQRALFAREDYPEAYNNLGTVLRELGQDEGAEHAYRRAIDIRPRYLEAHDNLALLLAGQKRSEDALRVLGRALDIDPRRAPTLVAVARVQLGKGSYAQAEQACRAALAIDPRNAPALVALAEICFDNDRLDEAMVALETVLAGEAPSWEARNLYANCLKAVGRMDDARRAFERTLADNPEAYSCYANLADLVEFTPDDPHLSTMERILAEAEAPDTSRYMPVLFAIGKAYDDIGEYAKAMAHWRRGAALRRRELDYDEGETLAFFDSIMRLYDADYFANPPFEGNPSALPVFIVGMPRSGSTLVEQIVASHPAAHGGGESKELTRRMSALRGRFPGLPRYPEMGRRMNADQYRMLAEGYLATLRAMNPSASRITDKLLSNFYFVGMLRVMFPNARFIHTARNPVDTCLSCYSKLFKDDLPHSYDFGELARFYARYQRLMDHWQRLLPKEALLTVAYEDVVADLDTQARRLVDFVGLPWDPACLAFHQSARPVKTASVVQVRKPVYATSVERRMRYGPDVQPLIDALCASGATVD